MAHPPTISTPASKGTLTQLPQEVFAAECESITRRRQSLNLAVPADLGQNPPNPALDLAGLAFSGGGIRSATFNLGVLQALQEETKNGHTLLERMDYLSTVSGGGYIGSALSANAAHAATTQPSPPASYGWFPFRHRPGQEENAAFRHLREYANYIAPKGLLNTLRIPVLVIRMQIINFLLVLPVLLLGAMVTALWLGQRVLALEKPSPPPIWNFFTESQWALTALILLSLTFTLAAWISRFTGEAPWATRNQATRSMGLVFFAFLFLLFMNAQPFIIHTYHTWMNSLLEQLQNPIKLLLTLAPGLMAMRKGFSGGQNQTPEGKAGLAQLKKLGLALLLPLFFYMVYLELCVQLIYGDLFFLLPQQSVFQLNTWLSEMTVFEALGQSTGLAGYYYGATYLAVTALLFVYGWVWVNVNETSLHIFYRDRLSRAYLFGMTQDAVHPHTDGLKLSALSAWGPYHLINTTLNVTVPPTGHNGRHTQDTALEANILRGRNADVFVFSKHYCGSPLTGYCPTQRMEQADGHLNLGTAMAISGAAVAPSNGPQTDALLRFSMAALNLRLNYWVPNPKKLDVWPAAWFRLYPPGPSYYLRELVGHLGVNSLYLNLSDGGHLENLAMYELLRRRCRFIIASDA